MTATTGAPHNLTFITSDDAVSEIDDINEIQIGQIAARLPISGTVTVTVTAGNAVGSEDITFPGGFFPAAPSIHPTVRGNDAFFATVDAAPNAPTAAGATLVVRRPAGVVGANTNVTVDWIAVRRN